MKNLGSRTTSTVEHERIMKKPVLLLFCFMMPFSLRGNTYAASTNVPAASLTGFRLSPATNAADFGSTNLLILSPNEWNGPFASWDDVKVTYGAVGDGAHDDTSALSNALANAGIGSRSPVVAFPPGAYKVTQQLNFVLRDGVRFVRKTGQRPVIKGVGISSGTMILADRTPRCSWEGFIFDGNGDTNLTLISQSMTQNNFFDTTCQYIDCVFTNAGRGLVCGDNGMGASE